MAPPPGSRRGDLLSASVGVALLAAALLVGSSSAARSKPSRFGPVAASFVSPKWGWALGSSGCSACAALRTTTDGGRTWTALPAPGVKLPWDTEGDVNDIAFADSKNGFLFGPKLLATHDGGKSWKREPLPRVQDLRVGAGYVFAVTHRWALAPARLWRARIGSDHWTRVSLPRRVSEADGLTGHFAVEGKELLVPGRKENVLWASSDSGRHWRKRTDPCRIAAGGDTVIAIARAHPRTWLLDCFDNRQSSQAMKTRHLIYRTVDGGASWALLHRPIRSNDPALLADNGAGHLFLATIGNADILVGSFDGGRHWPLQLGDRGSFGGWADLRFVTARTGFVVGPSRARGHVYRTGDSGRSWRIVPIK